MENVQLRCEEMKNAREKARREQNVRDHKQAILEGTRKYETDLISKARREGQAIVEKARQTAASLTGCEDLKDELMVS